eukprot:3264496-Rhodomonas_salina.1
MCIPLDSRAHLDVRAELGVRPVGVSDVCHLLEPRARVRALQHLCGGGGEGGRQRNGRRRRGRKMRGGRRRAGRRSCLLYTSPSPRDRG